MRRLHFQIVFLPGRVEMRSLYDRMLAFVLAVGLIFAAATIAYAGPYEDALAGAFRHLG